jgi:cytochrome P450
MGVTRSIDDLPGPRGLPLLGNVHEVRPSTLHSVAEGWCDRYGPIFRFRLGPRSVVCLAYLDAINAILRDRPNGYRRDRALKQNFDASGISGVFVAEGDEWRRQRRLTVTALNSNHLNRYFHIVHASTERLHQRFKELTHFRQGFDVGRELTSYAVDITSALAFGSSLDTLERRSSMLQEHIQRVFQINGRRLVMPVPYWRWVRLPADRAADRSAAVIRHAVERFIEQTRARIAEEPQLRDEPENFLQSMVAAQEAEGTFTDDEIIGNTFTLLLAGEDTTAHTMAWTLWLLASNPDVQTRWAQEADAVLGDQQLPSTFESVGSFRFGEAVLRESMRLKPVAPAIGLEPLEDATVMDTHLPAKTPVLLLTRHASLHGGGFEDANEFDPDRWMADGEDGSAARDQKAFLPFGAGPRFCPGRNLAFLESKSAMAMIARNFEVELDESAGPVTERLSFTMVPNALRVRVRERARAA